MITNNDLIRDIEFKTYFQCDVLNVPEWAVVQCIRFARKIQFIKITPGTSFNYLKHKLRHLTTKLNWMKEFLESTGFSKYNIIYFIDNCSCITPSRYCIQYTCIGSWKINWKHSKFRLRKSRIYFRRIVSAQLLF